MRRAMKIVGAIALGYAVLCLAAFVFQRRLIYFPIGEPGPAPDVLGGVRVEVEQCSVPTEDGETLHAWWIRRPKPIGSVVVSHGNAGHLGHRTGIAAAFVEWGFDAFLYDYRGFGHSSGSPDEPGLIEDSRAVWRYLTEQRGIPADSLVLYGESLGGAVSLRLATEVPARALVIEATFPSLPDVAAVHYPWLPVRRMCRDRFDSPPIAGSLRLPVLQLHSPEDEIVPVALARRLADSLPEHAVWHETSGGHNDGGFRASAASTTFVADWLRARFEPTQETRER